MNKIKFSDNNEIPQVGFGTWQLKGEECINAVKTALETGYRHIDTADAYENHEYIKQAIKDFPRDNLFITTKVWMDDYNNVDEAITRFKKELGIDYIDLVLLHWPDRSKDIVSALKKLQNMGDVKSFGVSNFTINHIKDLLDNDITPAVNQVEYHPFLNQNELLDFCQSNNIKLTAYSPVARGEVLKNNTLVEIGNKHSKNPAQVTLRWLTQKGLIVIPKSSKEDHIKSNFNLDFELDKDDMQKIESLNQNKRIINPSFGDFDY